MFLHWRECQEFLEHKAWMFYHRKATCQVTRHYHSASIFNKAFPLMMTSAGTVAPAESIGYRCRRVLGLQAIATAKRLGAVVSSFDVRTSTKEQVESLGAKFIEVKGEDSGETARWVC